MRYTRSQRYDINSASPYFGLIVSHIDGTDVYRPLNPFEDQYQSLYAMPAKFRSAWVVRETEWTTWKGGRVVRTCESEMYFKTREDAETYLNKQPRYLDCYRWLTPRCSVWRGSWGNCYTRYAEPYQVLVRA